jgi:hypothetical protein
LASTATPSRLAIVRLGFSWLAIVCVGGCFTGADALGLPCNEDLDCGVDQRCMAGFCGGPPAGTDTSTSTSTTTTSTSSSSESGNPQCTAMPGDPNYCMPVDPGTDDAECNFDCTAVLCGDGHQNAAAGEQCEPMAPGVSTCECDADDCSTPMCGDSFANMMAGEECDEGSNDEEYDACTPQCRANVFNHLHGDMTAWEVQTEGLSSGWIDMGGTWWSGDYEILDQMTDPGRAVAGITRLVSPPIQLPAADEELVLRFRHRYDFDPYCDASSHPQADGGRIELWMDGAPIPWPEADTEYPDTLVDLCTPGGAPPNPLGEVKAFAGTRRALFDSEIPLPAGAYGQTVQLVFIAGFDCGLCDVDDVPDGWRIDAVRIGPTMPKSCL